MSHAKEGKRSSAVGRLANEVTVSLLLMATIIALMFVKFGSLDLTLPLEYSKDPVYGSDIFASFMYIKNLILFGSPYVNPNIGMPKGADLYLYPARDLVWIGIIKLLSFVSTNVITVANLYFFVGYALNGLAFYICARVLGLRMMFSAFGACVYAFSPFGLRGLIHHSLFPYSTAPIGATLALMMFYAPRYPFLALRQWHWNSNWTFLVVGAAIVGASSIYWIAFTYLLVVCSATVAALSSRSWRPVGIAAVLLSMSGVVAVLAWVPEIYSIAGQYLASTAPLQKTINFHRSAYEQPIYGLRSLDMLLPEDSHFYLVRMVAEPYHSWTRDMHMHKRVEGADSYLGFAGITGLAMALFILAACMPCCGTKKPSFLLYRQYIIIGASLNILFAILFALPNGLGYVFNYAVLSFIRAQNRISVFILFLALMVFYLVADNLVRRLRGKVIQAVVIGMTAALSLLTIADFTPSFSFERAQTASASAFLADRDFFTRMQSLLPRDSHILQLPIVAFPEVGITQHMPDYEHFAGFLHTDGFGWSYGVLKNTREFLLQVHSFSDASVDDILANARRDGFNAILIDRRGFSDNGANLISNLTQRVGGWAVLLDDGVRLLIDLRQ